MWTRHKVHLTVCLLVFIWSGHLSEANVPQVTEVFPRVGSTNGETRITITGQNFAPAIFSLGDDNGELGNVVKLTDRQNFPCKIHPDGTHETQIVCYTSPMPPGVYNVKVSVNGVDVLDNDYCRSASLCQYSVKNDYTPTITQLTPLSGLPGEIIRIDGNLVTSKYLSNIGDEDQAQILRVFFKGQKCELLDDAGELYGLEYDVDTSKGQMICRPEGTFIGNNYVSYIVSHEFGRSMEDGETKHVRSNGISMYQTYTEIRNLSLAQGSSAGGTDITITGKHFDETVSKAQILIAGQPCIITEPVTDTDIVCRTPADVSDGATDFTGGRGFHAYVSSGIVDAGTINRTETPAEHLDSSSWKGYNLSSHTVLMVGYFVPFASGSYTFCIKAASTAKVYLSRDTPENKEKIDQGTNTCSKVSFTYLDEGQSYYIEVHYSSSSMDSYVTLNAFLQQTKYSEADTGYAQHEIQEFEIISSTDPEIQELDVTATGSTAQSPDVQRLEIGGDPSATFVIGSDGIYTITQFWLENLNAEDVKTALKKLPGVESSVQVALEENGPNKTLVITSDSTRGALSHFDGMQLTGSEGSLEFRTTRTSLGVEASNYFALSMNGLSTSPLILGASASKVKSELEHLFSVQCHPKLEEGTLQQFETKSWWMVKIVSDTEPFCGRYSLQNPTYIFVEDRNKKMTLSVSRSRYLCFGYKGLGGISYLRIYYKSYNGDGESRSRAVNINVNKAENLEVWNYMCEDIYTLLKNKHSSETQSVVWVRAYRKDYQQNLFIDQVAFRNNKPLADNMFEKISIWRKRQVQPNEFFIKSVDVSKTANKYRITLTPHDCGHHFPVFEAINGKVLRVQNASLPIEGSYRINFKGDTTDDIPVTVKADPDGVSSFLKNTEMGFSEVGGDGTCSRFSYTVKMVSHTGDQPLMSIDTSKLTGATAWATVSVEQEGGLWLKPIMGDLLRTHHKHPQAIAYINGVLTKCVDNSKCTFVYDPETTPTVSSVHPESGSQGNSVTISGTGFENSDNEDIDVTFGQTPCHVTAVTANDITCTVSNGPTGLAPVKVNVKDKGFTTGNVNFTFITDVTSVSPTAGSFEGGTVLTIDGFGFAPDAEVKVDGRSCVVINITESYIECMTPQAASLDNATVDVTIEQVGSIFTAENFTYSTADTPVISSINISRSLVGGGEGIEISGTDFGNDPMPVTLGGVKLKVISYANSEIIAVLPSLPQGSYRLLVQVEGKGYADLRTNSIPDISYIFVVNAMYPNFGSVLGGTDMSIQGEGFGESNLEVHIGDHRCNVQSVNDTHIKCRIEETKYHHHIFANGTHRSYGIGYAWDKDPLTVKPGDMVTWHWETPFYVSEITYSVRQTEKANDLQDMPGGFSSGQNTRKGSFSHTFTVPGEYHYWTGFMDSEGLIYFRGSVHVAELQSSSEALSVKMHGDEALYNTSGSGIAPSHSCPPVTSNVSGCVDNAELQQKPDRFMFHHLKCHTPIINGLSRTNGSFDDVISLTGNGLGDMDCQSEVIYGEDGCTIIESVSPSSIDFKISPSCPSPIAEIHKFKVYVNSLGYGLMSLPHASSGFGLIPQVSSVSQLTGSKVGGTKVIISGAGFVGETDDILVEFEKLTCKVESVNYTVIICKTVCASSPDNCYVGPMSFSVMVGNIPAQCDSAICQFETTDVDTPEVHIVSPNSTNENSIVLTFTGTKLASASDELTVMIGGVDCAVLEPVNVTYFACVIGRLPAGGNDISVYVSNLGKAATTSVVLSEPIASVSSPSESSVHGGATLVIVGNGFVEGETVVSIGGKSCSIQNISLSQILCTLPDNPEGVHNVVVTSNGEFYPILSVNYTSLSTPDVQNVNPSQGRHNDEIVITGTSFDSPALSEPTVTIGGVECEVTEFTSSSINCTAGVQSTGQYNVQVFVEDKGYSNDDEVFTYELSDFTLSPSAGSTNGGQFITLSGSGFLQNETVVTICGETCEEVSVTSSTYICKTPSHEAAVCEVVATVRDVVKTKSSAYTYDAALLSTITGVSPSRGGTGGGTPITITGTQFGTIMANIKVTIGGSPCSVTTVKMNSITCRTGASIKTMVAKVEVQKSGQGLAQQINADFEYIDVWSSVYTWGGVSLPEQGDFIIIQKGQKILLDTSPPVLKMLLIQGGHLLFDAMDIELQAEHILITDGGIFEIGTESKPFENNATITLHGHVMSKELPVYGAKGIGLREGFLELHGKHVPTPWTKLNVKAYAGDTVISLSHSVNWTVGSQIVIATTGGSQSQKESEVRRIEAVSDDGTELTLDEPLEYEHIATNGTYGSRFVEFKAEVGLLTRNILIRGYRNEQFDHKIEACPDKFNPGQFATQTCFQGRFGEEVGSDQYGVHILVHQQEKDTQVAQAHIEHVEIMHAGQAFRLGRYPIHFHLNGNMSESYVRGCAIHHTFNRAVNIHGSHNAMVERNVIYDVMGGALFLEDGDEVGNTFQYNLEIFVRASTSLRNDDITPAGIWATNPGNFIRHNAVAGGTHFGVWYRLHKNPDGPGFSIQICPQTAPMGEYINNTAHSQGWYGLWIFETYVPKDFEGCSSSAKHQAAKFYSLTAWSNNKGAEAVNVGSVQFHDFVLVNNKMDGIQFSMIVQNPPQYSRENGPGVFDSVIVARHEGLRGESTLIGITQPHYNGFMVDGVEFYNFDQSRSKVFGWVTIAGVCVDQCGGFTTVTNNLTFVDSPNKVRFAWENEGVLHDLDGSLTNEAGASVVACSGSFDSSQCLENHEMSIGVKGCICSKDIKLIRFAFNNISPKSLNYKRAHFTSSFGTTYSKWIEKRVSHKKGWQSVLMANTTYEITFEDAEQAINISFDGKLYRFSDGDYTIFTQAAYQMPDKVKLNGWKELPMAKTIPTDNNVEDGLWFYNSTDSKITYSLQNMVGNDKTVFLRLTRCWFRGCKPPPSPMSVIKQPSNAESTSVPETWKNLTNHGNEPQPGDDLYVSYERWIVVDTVLPRLGKVVIEGGLQFSEAFLDENVLEADYIYIKGRLVAGWSNEIPFRGKLTIRLRGEHSTPNYDVSDGPNLGSKFIAVFGGLQLHGIQRNFTKTHLAMEASVNDGSITVQNLVDWAVGEDILISTTSYNAWHTEVFQITGVSGKTLSLNGTIKYHHVAHEEDVNGKIIQLRASVALLTRNIRVEGAEYDDLIEESFGARIIVGQTASNDEMFSGFAQVSNVEFYHCGQEGFASSFDARYALTYMGVTSTKEKVRYSYVRQNAFHNGFSPAIGVFGTDDIEIDDNTIHHTVGPGIQTESTGTRITNNLVTLSIWPGAYLNRKEAANYDFSGAIDGRKSSQLVLINNIVAGSERAGYTVPGQLCNTVIDDMWSGNLVHGAQTGVALFPVDPVADSTCIAFMGFTLWKNFDYGMYLNNNPSLLLKDNIFVENSVGVTPFVIGPASVSHAYADKSVTIENNLFIGKTSSFSESLDLMPSDDNVALSGQTRGLASTVACGKRGLMIGTFTSGSNSSPRKPWLHIMSYQAINGVTIIKGNTFAKFGPCNGGKGFDHIITTNKFNQDVIHPSQFWENILINVDPKSKILYHKPDTKWVNPSDCVDMDCDAHKKNLLTDLDGTFLGHRGTVLPNSAYEWDGDRRHGVGDYRIPLVMLSTPDGNKIDPDVKAPIKGLYKIDECTWIPEWVAFECNNSLEWKMVVAESLDADTETRRLSPVAVFNKEGYVDLINGPQDHGWCSGYTCQKRLSTFPILVALDHPFEIFLSSTNPKRMRFMLLNSKPTDCVKLSMYYNAINRLEVKVNNQLVIPNNGFYDSKGRYRMKLENVKGELSPDVMNKTVGENYVSQEDQTITWIQCGGAEVVVTRVDALLVSFTLPELTVDQFFGEDIIENLAAFLKIDPKKVRVVNIVTNTSPNGKRRRKRSTTSTVYVEISDTPDETPSLDVTEISDEIINLVQTGSVKEVLKVDVLYTAIIPPESSSSTPVVLQKPGQLVLETPPEGLVAEDVLLSVQPKLKVIDANGDVVTHLGSSTIVWEVEASIKSGGTSRATLLGTTRMNFTEGWANFTDLAISDLGEDYILEFQIVSPAEATNYTIDSPTLHIFGKQFRPKATLLTTRRLTDTPIELEVSLVDKDTDLDFTDIDWDDHTWEAEIEIYNEDSYTGALSGTLLVTFDPATGKGKFSNILLDKPGNCTMLVTIKSNPDGYLLKMVVYIDLRTPEQDSILVEESHQMEIRFPITFNRERAPFWAAQLFNAYSAIPGLRIIKVTYRPGSIIFTLDIEANKAGYNSTLNAMCGDIEKGRNFTFDGTTVKMSEVLIIDDKPYYGVSCGPISKDDDGLDLKYIIIIAVLAVIILILLAVLIYKCCVSPSSKTGAISTTNTTPLPAYYLKGNDLLADVLLREESSSSLKSKSAIAPMSTRKRQSPFEVGMSSSEFGTPRHTPSPAWTQKKF